MKKWSDSSILLSIKNPTLEAYEIKIKCPELTFLGVKNQPDFADIYVTFYPTNKVLELKSFKQYLYQFRNKIVSYERLANIIYDDIIEIYDPARLRIVMIFNPRGGISSRLTIDSDWKVRGGKEEFVDWNGQQEEW